MSKRLKIYKLDLVLILVTYLCRLISGEFEISHQRHFSKGETVVRLLDRAFDIGDLLKGLIDHSISKKRQFDQDYKSTR